MADFGSVESYQGSVSGQYLNGPAASAAAPNGPVFYTGSYAGPFINNEMYAMPLGPDVFTAGAGFYVLMLTMNFAYNTVDATACRNDSTVFWWVEFFYNPGDSSTNSFGAFIQSNIGTTDYSIVDAVVVDGQLVLMLSCDRVDSAGAFFSGYAYGGWIAPYVSF